MVSELQRKAKLVTPITEDELVGLEQRATGTSFTEMESPSLLRLIAAYREQTEKIERLRKAATYALASSTERHTNTHTNCTHVSCHLRRALDKKEEE